MNTGSWKLSFCICDRFSDTGVTVAASLTLKQEPIIRDIIIGEVHKFINFIDLEYYDNTCCARVAAPHKYLPVKGLIGSVVISTLAYPCDQKEKVLF